MSLRAVSFQMHDADFTAKYCHYRRNSGDIEGCERPSNTLFSWEIMTNSRFLAGFVISRSSVRIRLPAHLNCRLWITCVGRAISKKRHGFTASNVGGFAGEVEMFENLAAQAEE